MEELNQLRASLEKIFHEALPTVKNFENHEAINELLKITRELNGIGSAPTSASLSQVIAEYRESGKVAKFRDLKYVCYGAALRMPDGWCLLGDDEFREKLLQEVEHLTESRSRLKCFQALLSSYFAFARYDEQTSKAAHNGWEILRTWLARQRTQFQREGMNKKLRLPVWFAVLTNHENLLTNEPCSRYGNEMLHSDNASIEEARQGLGILRESWVMEETILSLMKTAAELDEALFKAQLDQLLKIIQGQTDAKVSELLKHRSIAILVCRYARCTSKPEHPILRDAAVAIIGNPWLKKTQWDAWAKKPDGQPDNEAREMVNGWLTRQLITDFFELLSADGQADPRRLNYWLRFVPAIEGTPWLALGPDSMHNNSQPYRDLRERAKGRLLRLENPGASNNNAFIMKMGEWLIVEFGVKGNACYVYPATQMPFSLRQTAISLHDLKDKNRGDSYRHADGHKLWESNFDQAICPKIAYWPSKETSNTKQSINSLVGSSSPYRVPPSDQEFNEDELFDLAGEYSLQIEDHRSQGGALWVKIEKERNLKVDQWLQKWGFKYKQGRGWWRE